MPSFAGLQVKDYVTWLLTAVALAWNFYNFLYARKLRRDTFELDEWKLERGDVLRALREFEGEVDLMLLLSSGAHQLEKLREEITASNQKIVVAHLKLVREVERATELKLPPALAYGAAIDQETAWDRINEALADIALLEEAIQIRLKLPAIAAHARAIAKGVSSMINSQRSARIKA